MKQVAEAAGMDISYAREDLAFLEHNGFLLQFTEGHNLPPGEGEKVGVLTIPNGDNNCQNFGGMIKAR